MLNFSVLLVDSDNNSNNFEMSFYLGSLELARKKVAGEGNHIKVEIEACAHARVYLCVRESKTQVKTS